MLIVTGTNLEKIMEDKFKLKEDILLQKEKIKKLEKDLETTNKKSFETLELHENLYKKYVEKDKKCNDLVFENTKLKNEIAATNEEISRLKKEHSEAKSDFKKELESLKKELKNFEENGVKIPEMLKKVSSQTMGIKKRKTNETVRKILKETSENNLKEDKK